jgi:hypothetical protein
LLQADYQAQLAAWNARFLEILDTLKAK